MKEKTHSKTGILLLSLLIIAELIYTTFTFAYKKQGVHSDEIWSYGLANSNYKPFVYMKEGSHFNDSDNIENIDNVNKWISSEVLKNYITVQPGEKFDYKSVYSNQTYDNHPPLYYCLLHTICSFFPDKFSYWYSYIINVFALIFTQIFLYKLAMVVTKEKKPFYALLTCLLYGGGAGALSTFIFLRMYAPLTAIATAHIYFQFRLFHSENFNIKKNIIPVAISGLLGLLTDNLFAVIMGLCTACICIWLLCNKKIKKMFIYGFSMLGTLAVSFAIFPHTILQVLQIFTNSRIAGVNGVIYPFTYNLEYYLNSLLGLNLGIKIKLDIISPEVSLVLTIIGTVIILMLPVCFLFRKKPFFVKIRTKFTSLFRFVKENISKINYPVIFTLIIPLIYSMVVSKTVDSETMGRWAARYIMPVFPLICVFGVSVIRFVFSKIRKIQKYAPAVTAFCVALILVNVNITAESPFLNIQTDDYVDVSKETKNYKCEAVIYPPWRMTCYQAILKDCSQVKFALPQNFYDTDTESVNLEGIEDNETMFILMDKGGVCLNPDSTEEAEIISEKEIVDSLNENSKVNSVKLLGHIKIQNSKISVYRIN